MTEKTRKDPLVHTYPLLVLAFTLVSILILAAGCSDSPNKNGSSNEQASAPVKKEHPLIGTWVSSESPDKQFIFTEDGVTYKELGYSVLLEEAGKYKLNRNGNIEWSITWYSGGVTHWKGKLEDEKIKVEYTNSWDGSQGKDILRKIQETK